MIVQSGGMGGIKKRLVVTFLLLGTVPMMVMGLIAYYVSSKVIIRTD